MRIDHDGKEEELVEYREIGLCGLIVTGKIHLASNSSQYLISFITGTLGLVHVGLQ